MKKYNYYTQILKAGAILFTSTMLCFSSPTTLFAKEEKESIETVTIAIGDKLDPKDALPDSEKLPTDAKVEWKEKVDFSKLGEYKATIVITYKNGKSKEIDILVEVKTEVPKKETVEVKNEPEEIIEVKNEPKDSEKYEPASKTDLKTKVNQPIEPKDTIENVESLPEGTKFAWKEGSELDVSTKGTKSATVEIIYLDESKDEVEISVEVYPLPESQEITVLGNSEVPKAEEGIKNLSELPEGTEVKWENEPDVSKGGKILEEKAIVTYPDSSTEEVSVTINVTKQSDAYEPIAKDVETEIDVTPKASTVITNLDQLPKDIKYGWVTSKKPDVSKAGETQGTIGINYSDGTQDLVVVNVEVIAKQKDEYEPEAKDLSTTVGDVPVAKSGIKNYKELPDGTKIIWASKPDVSKSGKTKGTALVTYPDGSSEKVEITVTVKGGSSSIGGGSSKSSNKSSTKTSIQTNNQFYLYTLVISLAAFILLRRKK